MFVRSARERLGFASMYEEDYGRHGAEILPAFQELPVTK